MRIFCVSDFETFVRRRKSVFFFEWNKFFFFFFEKNIQNGRLKKSSFFKIANSRNFFAKISEIGPRVSRIEWCEGHWCSSTYVAVTKAQKQPKSTENAFFGCFWAFVRQPHGHIHWATLMPFTSFNPTNPRTDLRDFREKISRIGDFEK